MALYSRSRARRSLFDTAVFRGLSQVATMLGFVVMVRGMSREDFGVLSLLYAFIPVVSTFASLGLEQTLKRFQPEYLKAENFAAAAWLVRFVASARFATSVIVLSAVLLGWNVLSPLFKITPYRLEFALFCLLILIFFQSRILQLSLASQMLHRVGVGSTAILSVAKLLAYSVLTWCGELTLNNAIGADAIAFAVAYLFLLRASRKFGLLHEVPTGYRPERDERRRLLRYGLFNNFNDAGTLMLSSKSDNFFIAAILDPVSVGVYSFYTRLNEMTRHLLPVKLFENVVNPMFFSVPSAEAESRIPAYFTFLLNMNLMLQLPVLALSFAFHSEVVQLVFAGKFIEYSWMLPLIVSFAAANSVAVPVTLVAQYDEKSGVILASKVLTIYNVIALLALLPVVGLYGAAIASGSAQVLKSMFIWWHVRARARWMNAGDALLWGGGIWAAVVGLCWLLKMGLNIGPFWTVLGGISIALVGLLVHLRSPAIATGDRALLGSIFRGKESRLLKLIGLLAVRHR